MRLILASASPRRAELLRLAEIDFEVRPANVDERVLEGEAPEPYARRLSELKACAVAAAVRDRLVLAADTIVVVDGAILGKPADAAEARRMLERLSGRSHDVITAVTLARTTANRPPSVLETAAERTTVEFAPIQSEEIDWYVRSGEPMDKAGAYAIQGRASRYVTRIAGSYSNVVGLPVALVYQLLRRHGTARRTVNQDS